MTLEERSEIKTNISNWAFCSEKLMHGNPSGVDNTVCTFGQLVKFSRGSKPSMLSLQAPLNVLLINTGVNRSTATLVQNVANLKQSHPEIIEHILNAMGSVVDDVVGVVTNDPPESIEYFPKLERLVSINNNLLRALFVSHPVLEKIFSICERNGFSSKLTGAGGGGYAFVLLPANYKSFPKFKELCNELDANKFEWNETIIGGSGVEIAN